MKVYVVEAGQYSDRHIEQIFLDKKKAENYVKYRNSDPDWYDYASVTEYDTADEGYAMQRNGYYHVDMESDIYLGNKANPPYFKTREEINIEIYSPSTRTDLFEDSGILSDTSYTKSNDIWRLHLERFFPECGMDEDAATAKIKKIFYDTAAEIRSLVIGGMRVKDACRACGVQHYRF